MESVAENIWGERPQPKIQNASALEKFAKKIPFEYCIGVAAGCAAASAWSAVKGNTKCALGFGIVVPIAIACSVASKFGR